MDTKLRRQFIVVTKNNVALIPQTPNMRKKVSDRINWNYYIFILLISSILIFFLLYQSGCRKKITPFSIIYTSNLKGNALPILKSQPAVNHPIHHFSQVAEIIKRLKKGEKNPILLLDAGNFLTGYDDFSKTFNGSPMLNLMEFSQYDAVMLAPVGNINIDNLKVRKPFLKSSDARHPLSFCVRDINRSPCGDLCPLRACERR